MEIRRILCFAIEPLNARFRRAVTAKDHFPTERAALKYVYLAVMTVDRTMRGAHNAVDITFNDRLSAHSH